MYSYSHFKPGAASCPVDLRHPGASCTPGYNKFIPASNSASYSTPRAIRIANVVRNSASGGNLHFGNYSVTASVSLSPFSSSLDAFGRMEGMPGGSGIAPTNRLR